MHGPVAWSVARRRAVVPAPAVGVQQADHASDADGVAAAAPAADDVAADAATSHVDVAAVTYRAAAAAVTAAARVPPRCRRSRRVPR